MKYAEGFKPGDLERKYEKTKKQGKCPYDSFDEYMESLVYGFPPGEGVGVELKSDTNIDAVRVVNKVLYEN